MYFSCYLRFLGYQNLAEINLKNNFYEVRNTFLLRDLISLEHKDFYRHIKISKDINIFFNKTFYFEHDMNFFIHNTIYLKNKDHSVSSYKEYITIENGETSDAFIEQFCLLKVC